MWWAIPAAIVGFGAVVVVPIILECIAEKRYLEQHKDKEEQDDR